MVKCSGLDPCERCTSRNLRCDYDSNLDQRTQRGELKRRLDGMEEQTAILRGIVDALRNSNDNDESAITEIVRRDVNYNDIHRSLQHYFAKTDKQIRERSPARRELNNQVWTVTQTSRSMTSSSAILEGHRKKRVLDVSHIVDRPPIRIKAQPWTNVTTDDTLVSHIFSAWMMWERPLFNWIDRELLLQDMQAGELGARFCSPFLVNAMLACACSFGDYPEVRNIRGAPSHLMSRFIAEAKSYVTEEDDINIPFAQALALLYLAESHSGRDGTAYTNYFRRIGKICDKLISNIENCDDTEFVRATIICCWGIFNLASMNSWTVYGIPYPVKTPTHLDVLAGISEDKTNWMPYPLAGPTASSFDYEILYQRARLSMITQDPCLFSDKSKGQRPNVVQARALLQRTIDWHADLPSHLCKSEHASPPVLLLQ